MRSRLHVFTRLFFKQNISLFIFCVISSSLFELSTNLSISTIASLCYAMPLSNKAYNKNGSLRKKEVNNFLLFRDKTFENVNIDLPLKLPYLVF